MRHTVIELFHVAAGLALAAGLTAGAAWAYPLGRGAIWVCGGLAMLATAAMSVTPLRRAMAQDRKRP